MKGGLNKGVQAISMLGVANAVASIIRLVPLPAILFGDPVFKTRVTPVLMDYPLRQSMRISQTPEPRPLALAVHRWRPLKRRLLLKRGSAAGCVSSTPTVSAHVPPTFTAMKRCMNQTRAVPTANDRYSDRVDDLVASSSATCWPRTIALPPPQRRSFTRPTGRVHPFRSAFCATDSIRSPLRSVSGGGLD